MTDLRNRVIQLQEKVQPSTPPKVLEKRRGVAVEATKKIEEAKEICAKDVDQVSHTWEV